MSEITTYYSALSTTLNLLGERNYPRREFLESMNNLFLVVQDIRNLGKNLGISKMVQFDMYFETFGEICLEANYFLRDKGEGFLLAFLTGSIMIFKKMYNTIDDPESQKKFYAAVGHSPVKNFSESFAMLPYLSLTERCLLATYTRTWLETLCMGMMLVHPEYASLSRLAYKQLRNEADRGYTAIRMNDTERTREIIHTPLICITQIFNRIPSQALNDNLIIKLYIDDLKEQGVTFGNLHYAIGQEIHTIPSNFIPMLTELQKSM